MNDMDSEFDESEMSPCEICGEFWPMDDMYELEDGSVICPDCMENYGLTCKVPCLSYPKIL